MLNSAQELVSRGGCSCEQLVLSLQGDERAHNLDSPRLSGCRLRVSAQEPTALTFTSAALENSALEVTGPVTLHFVGATSLADTSIDVVQDARDGASIEISESSASGVTIRGGPTSLHVSRSRWVASNLESALIDVESSSFTSCTLRSLATTLVDVRLHGTAVHGSGSISASHLDTTLVEDCETLLIAGSAIKESQLAACSALLRLYETDVETSFVDGPIEADSSSFGAVGFGTQAATTLLSFASRYNNSAFCGNTEQLRSSSDSLACMRCEGIFETPIADACSNPQGPPALDSNLCPTVNQVAECTESFPQRTRN